VSVVRQGGYHVELLQYDDSGSVNATYNLTSPVDQWVGADNVTYVSGQISKLLPLHVWLLLRSLLLGEIAFCSSSDSYAHFSV